MPNSSTLDLDSKYVFFFQTCITMKVSVLSLPWGFLEVHGHSVLCLALLHLGIPRGFRPRNMDCVVTLDNIFVKMHAKEEMAMYSLGFVACLVAL